MIQRLDLLYEIFSVNLIKSIEKIPGIRRRIRRLARTMEVPDAKLTIQAFGRTQVKVGEKS